MWIALVLGALFAVLTASSAGAQSRPAATEDPESAGAGNIRADLGVTYDHGAIFPPSGLHGNLTQYGTFDLSFGVSSVADIQLDGGFHNELSITARDPGAPLASLVTATGNSTGDVQDGMIGAKVRFLPETADRPSLGFRFSTRLPNSKHDSGLGMDTMDFHFMLLSGKTIGSTRLVGNFGWAILEDPVRDGIQNDVITYGATVGRTVRRGVEIVADINGRLDTRHGTPPIGTESRSSALVGPRITHGSVRYDAAVIFGLTTHDAAWGVTGGVTCLFHAFTIP